MRPLADSRLRTPLGVDPVLGGLARAFASLSIRRFAINTLGDLRRATAAAVVVLYDDGGPIVLRV